MLKELHNQAWQLTAVIPTTQEAEMRRIRVGSQPQVNTLRDPVSKKNSSQEKDWWCGYRCRL
jgi:hypothetical protein